MQRKIDESEYIAEIEVWKKASAIHAKKAIEQYEAVVENLEQFGYEKQTNESILNSLHEIVIVYKNDKRISIFNKSACDFFDLNANEIIGKNINNLPQELFLFLNSYRNIDTIDDIICLKENYFKLNEEEIHIEDETFYIVSLNDISNLVGLQTLLQKEKDSLEEKVSLRTVELQDEIQRKKVVQGKLESMVYVDYLTGLPNRKHFNQKLEFFMQEISNKNSYDFSLFFIDLDGFKSINDTLGHNAGDELLIEVSKILQKSVRNNDFVARLAGDEFVILVDQITSKEDIERIGKNILSLMSEPITVSRDHKISISCSIGILMNPSKDLDKYTILSLSDRAMYRVKENGKKSYCFFDEYMFEEFHQKVELMKKIDDALENDEFYIEYQPVCSKEGIIVSSEALARWRHQGQNISPFYFIPILEEKGRINSFTYNVIDMVIRDFEEGLDVGSVSINFSAFQFYDTKLLEFLEEKACKYPHLTKRINFEITEGVFTTDPELVHEKLTIIRALGHKIYIDDFGTGYSSFDYIRKYPIDVLKIDKVFVDEIIEDEKQYKLLKGMLSFADSLEMSIIVEGVEKEEQVNYIKALGIDLCFQGYYFYKPMEKEKLLSII